MDSEFLMLQCVLSFWGLVLGFIVAQMMEEPAPFVLKDPPKERPPKEAFECPRCHLSPPKKGGLL